MDSRKPDRVSHVPEFSNFAFLGQQERLEGQAESLLEGVPLVLLQAAFPCSPPQAKRVNLFSYGLPGKLQATGGPLFSKVSLTLPVQTSPMAPLLQAGETQPQKLLLPRSGISGHFCMAG